MTNEFIQLLTYSGYLSLQFTSSIIMGIILNFMKFMYDNNLDEPTKHMVLLDMLLVSFTWIGIIILCNLGIYETLRLQ